MSKREEKRSCGRGVAIVVTAASFYAAPAGADVAGFYKDKSVATKKAIGG